MVVCCRVRLQILKQGTGGIWSWMVLKDPVSCVFKFLQDTKQLTGYAKKFWLSVRNAMNRKWLQNRLICQWSCLNSEARQIKIKAPIVPEAK